MECSKAMLGVEGAQGPDDPVAQRSALESNTAKVASLLLHAPFFLVTVEAQR